MRNKSSVFAESALKCMVSLPPFSFQNSTTRSTDDLEHWVTSFFETSNHLCGVGILFSAKCVAQSSVPLLFITRA